MTHEKYIIRALDEKAHIFEKHEKVYENRPERWTSTTSLCGMIVNFHQPSEPGDGRPTCRVCARIARKRKLLESQNKGED